VRNPDIVYKHALCYKLFNLWISQIKVFHLNQNLAKWLRKINYILRLLSPKGTRYANVPPFGNAKSERNDKDLKFLECVNIFALLLIRWYMTTYKLTLTL
jgi:hypothetical protein